MKPMISTAAAALLALAACGGEGGGEANESTANQANNAAGAAPADGKDPAANATNEAAAPAAAEAGEGGRATAAAPAGIRALLIGRWTDNGDCAAATEFRNDGTFTSPAGAGRWTLESEYLTLAIPGAPEGEVAVQVIDRREMETVSPMGRIGRWTRC